MTILNITTTPPLKSAAVPIPADTLGGPVARIPENENELFDDQDGEENDPGAVSSADVHRAVVTDTDWTTETILSQLRRGNIQLNPHFQRRDAWDRARKSKFIESLILGLPVPQIVLAEDRKQRGKFIVLDGKQRLLTLRQFAIGSSLDVAGGDEGSKAFGLTNLDVRGDLRLKTLAKLEEDGAFIDDLNALLNETIRTVVVRRWPNEEFLNLVFLRLNTGSVRLSPQELRQALHPGKFTDFLDVATYASSEIQAALRIKKPDFRMRDVEIMLRYYAMVYRLGEYKGNLKKFLDDTVNELNAAWVDDEEEIKETADECNRAIQATFDVFGEDAFYRWSRGDYEGRFNRAVFDIMTYYFRDPVLASAAIENKGAVEQAFKALCDTDPDFVESIQTTTKTPFATHTRLSLWGDALERVTGAEVPIPRFENNRLIP
ncbi:DUF262 domain-containing protein [Streptomyces poonensis]|uniref:GmrSD restriction endonucleases N-terminal domain-containing protein n=1 Tax=Streptomyces poonensis TaxID=68255 RepID=A0A918UMM1_9ACTN|nr:DUF262 domain-containing protein [Streptomyces poonensis]GGZ22675.1 hypothetical protein GCM10010365_48640 [Streptomyces poonensis]GLJ91848.1 hypothetical protein GCM10017589_44560 [Streptomyces poonensis]